MLQFDERGHLYPYEIIEMTLGEFEEFFVSNLDDKVHRKELFESYLMFLNDLKLSLKAPFYQWVGGSFLTKKPFPGDIDLVTFVDYDVFIKAISIVDHFTHNAFEKYRVDAHFASYCKWNHRYYQRSKEIEEDWKDIYGSSRKINGKSDPKGLIKINFPK